MIKLYFSRASINKEKFTFEKIRDEIAAFDGGDFSRILFIVPDQYTITAERIAFDIINSEGFMDLEILSFTRLMARIIEDTKGSKKIHIDKYGRHMLLEKIIEEKKQELEAFKGIEARPSFIEMVNNLISEMKQFNTKPEDIIEIIEASKEKELLKLKLKDIYNIFNEYEKAISDKYLDTEDFINLVSNNTKSSKFIEKSLIYFYGFDYFSPKAFKVIEQLAIYSKEIDVILMGDQADNLFELTQNMADKFRDIATYNNEKLIECEIPSSFLYEVSNESNKKKPELAHLEKELFAFPFTQYSGKIAEENLELYLCSNNYTETENAAAKILELVRERGLKFEEIVVIANDIESRSSIIQRIFAEYEIPYFIDSSKSLNQNPFVKFIISILNIVEKGYQFEDIFTFIKTGLVPISTEMGERLENYAFEYRLSKKNWTSGFKYFKRHTDEETLEILNRERARLVEFVSKFEGPFMEAKTVKAKTLALYKFLLNTALFPNKALEMSDEFKRDGNEEQGEEFAQIWDSIIHIMDQMVELIGENQMNITTYREMLETGFNSIELGIMPQIIDQVVVGTMQRTRTKDIKALIVMGANDGILPKDSNGEDLLSEDEKQYLFNKNYEFCKNDNFRRMEESLGIYSSITRPQDYLYLSYSSSDNEGKELRPSIIFDKITKIFPDIKVKKDILSSSDLIKRIGNKQSVLRHMTYEIKKGLLYESTSDFWKHVFNWFQRLACKEDEEICQRFNVIQKGLSFENFEEEIGNEIVHLLYGKGEELDIVLSTSRIESFAKCPFAYLIGYGLKAMERKQDQFAGREMGDIYHECIMRLSKELTNPDIPVSHEDSDWMKISKEECTDRITKVILEMQKDYINPDLDSASGNRYRFQRIIDVCDSSAWAIISQVKAGKIKEFYFEAEFGRDESKPFREIEVNLGKEKVHIEGKIDRVDILQGEDQNFVKVIDYKSGSDKFDFAQAKSGVKLQLLLYLKAASESLSLDPCAAFYFKIDKPLTDITELKSDEENIEAKIDEKDIKVEIDEKNIKAINKDGSEYLRNYKLDGIILEDKQVIDAIDSQFAGFSSILPVRKKIDGSYSSSANILSKEEFTELQNTIDEKLIEICSAITDGQVSISPRKIKDQITACTYCQFKSICNFDQCFKGNEYTKL